MVTLHSDAPAAPASTTPTSRRALLAAAAGGAAAVAAALARPLTVSAAVGDPLLAGQSTGAGGSTTTLFNTSTSKATLKVTQKGTNTALAATANKGTAGRFVNWTRGKFAVVVTNKAGTNSYGRGGAIQANGGANIGVRATTDGSWAVWASGPTGVLGTTGSGGYGVYGYSDGGGYGLVGGSASSYAGYFFNQVFMDSYLDIDEIVTPTAPAANNARLFVRDSGGKTQLCVLFPTGAVQVLSTEP